MSPRERERGRPGRRQRVSERTTLRRADHGCTEEEIRLMKRMRDHRRMSFKAIADVVGKTEEAVKLALAATRSPNPGSGKRVVNIDDEGLGLLLARALPGETRGQTFVRVLREYEHFERLLRR